LPLPRVVLQPHEENVGCTAVFWNRTHEIDLEPGGRADVPVEGGAEVSQLTTLDISTVQINS
jgi:hypothetical protein